MDVQNIHNQIKEHILNALNKENISRDEAIAQGKEKRKTCPRFQHEKWLIETKRKDSVSLIFEQEKDRVQELIPIRHKRMQASPFAFFRGAAIIMANDLAKTPTTNLKVQACGDAHIANFGVFASPERRLVFDINDFDETSIAPFEWDVKRLCASIEICARDRGFIESDRTQAIKSAIKAYCEAMNDYSKMGALDVYYDHMDLEKMADEFVTNKKTKKIFNQSQIKKAMDKAITKNREKAMDQLTEYVDGQLRIISKPPLIVPFRELNPEHEEILKFLELALQKYRLTLPKERRHLFDQYTFCDVARKVVGVGSVGTRAWIMVFSGVGEGDPLILQIKEANASVLEPYAGKSIFLEHGRRVIEGQRAIQTAGDILTGWMRLPDESGHLRDYYVRQLWDHKASLNLEKMSSEELIGYASLCGRTLAHAHAKTGNRHMIAGYLGTNDTFSDAITHFAKAYGDQNEIDYQTFLTLTK